MIDDAERMGLNFGVNPEVYAAAIDEANQRGLGTMTHHAQTRVVYNNALHSAQLGLTSMTHWYGLPEALFEDRIIQDYPLITIIIMNSTVLKKPGTCGLKQRNRVFEKVNA